MVAKRLLRALRFAAFLAKVNSRTPAHVSQARSSRGRSASMITWNSTSVDCGGGRSLAIRKRAAASTRCQPPGCLLPLP